MGDRAALVLRTADGKETALRSIDTLADALAVLADRRLAFAWPSLLAWAGDDLGILRERAVVRAKAVLDARLHPPPPTGHYSPPASDQDTILEAMIRYIGTLDSAGRHGEAIALARQQIASPATSNSASFARARYITLLGDLLFGNGRQEEAITDLTQASADPSVRPVWKVNIDVNLAALLAQDGQYARALSKIDDAESDFTGEKHVTQLSFFAAAIKMPNAWAQFAWIRACALDGLGREADARAVMAKIISQPSTSHDLSTTMHARIEGLRCMGDVPGLAEELAAQLPSAPLASDLFLEVQPLYAPKGRERDTLEAAVRHPALASAVVDQFRVVDGPVAAALEAAEKPDPAGSP